MITFPLNECLNRSFADSWNKFIKFPFKKKKQCVRIAKIHKKLRVHFKAADAIRDEAVEKFRDENNQVKDKMACEKWMNERLLKEVEVNEKRVVLSSAQCSELNLSAEDMANLEYFVDFRIPEDDEEEGDGEKVTDISEAKNA